MRDLLRVLLAVSLVTVLSVTQGTGVQGQQVGAQQSNFVPEEVIVAFRPNTTAAQRAAAIAAQGGTLIRDFTAIGLSHVRLTPGRNAVEGAAAFASQFNVTAAAPNYLVQAVGPAPPNDPFWLSGTLWGLEKIQAHGVWTTLSTVGDPSVIVADIDSGVQYDHPDLAANMWTNPGEVPGNGVDDDGNGYVDDVYGIDTFNDDSDPDDDNGHGTHTSGTIAGVGNNGTGVVGVTWNTKIVACKFLGASGSGSDAGAIECFNYLVDLVVNHGQNIRVSNNSWGRLGSYSSVMQIAIDAAGAAGIVNVFAAGNNGIDTDVIPHWPASMTSPSIISVANSTSTDAKAGTSNWGDVSVDLAAPGTSIVSTYPTDGYASASGTSMAAPHVAGAAAMLLAMDPSLTVAQVKALLLGNVDVLPQWAGLVLTGGRLNLFAAASAVNSPPSASIVNPFEGSQYEAPASITVEATAVDLDGSVTQVQFFANGSPIGTDTTSPYSIGWSGVAAGSYALTAVATDDKGATGTSDPVLVTVNPPGGGASAVFVETDTTTHGSWSGTYGMDGYNVIADQVSYPAYASVTPTGQSSWTWTGATSDVRALQRASGPGRLAAAWYGSSFSLDLNLTDGQPHEVAFYGVDWDSTSRSQRFDVRDAISGAVLDSRTVSNFNGGIYIVWTITGHVRIDITRLAGANAVLSGIFFDTSDDNQPPSVAITQPGTGASFEAPATFTVAANAADPDGFVTQVEFLANGSPIGLDTISPYSISWTDVPAGAYSLTAVATDDDGATKTSAPVNVVVTAPGGGPSAVFVGTDTVTQGSWNGAYGGDGYNVIGDQASYPPYASVAPTGQSTWTWTGSTSDVRALQRASGPGRLAATWYGSSFSIDIDLTDGQPHQVALYSVDWDSTVRSQRFDVRDAAGGAVLDTRTVNSFNGGVWTVWTISGHVRIVVTSLVGPNAVISGIFFDAADGNQPPTVAITQPAAGASFEAPAALTVAADASDADGTVTQVQFFANGAPIGLDATSPYSISWTGVGAGAYSLTAVATDDDGATKTSASVNIVVSAPGGGASAVFVGTDSSTQGNWNGVYGLDGYNVITDQVSYPSYASVAPTGQSTWTWTGATTDVRALQRASGPGRLAATWYGASFSIDVQLTDGQVHQLAIYSVDWDSTARSQRFDVRDAVSGVLLSSQTISGFNSGRYVIWNVSGHVRIDVTVLAGANSVASGVFFDPVPPAPTAVKPSPGPTGIQPPEALK